MEVIGSTELVGSYWFKTEGGDPFEFTIYGYQSDILSNDYDYYDVYDNGGVQSLLGWFCSEECYFKYDDY